MLENPTYIILYECCVAPDLWVASSLNFSNLTAARKYTATLRNNDLARKVRLYREIYKPIKK
jgi:hypothetical protein